LALKEIKNHGRCSLQLRTFSVNLIIIIIYFFFTVSERGNSIFAIDMESRRNQERRNNSEKAPLSGGVCAHHNIGS
jgi:capsule polysaccharide export protein KpsE/RkpR